MKTCKNLVLQFIERRSPLSNAAEKLLLESDSFENFHVELIIRTQSFSPIGVDNLDAQQQLLKWDKICGILFGRDVYTRICKLVLSRSDHRKLKALLAQRDAQRSLSELPASRPGEQKRRTNQSKSAAEDRPKRQRNQ